MAPTISLRVRVLTTLALVFLLVSGVDLTGLSRPVRSANNTAAPPSAYPLPHPLPLLSPGVTTRVSVASDGTQGNSYSEEPSISADGRYVAFYSYASNLVSGDTNGQPDVFVHDRQSGQTTRVSVDSSGAQRYDNSAYPSISASTTTCGTWSVVPSPNPGTYSILYGVAVVSADDVWAVGGYGSSPNQRTIIEHWNGTSWSVVPSPNPGTRDNFLLGVVAVSANDVWAVGYYSNDSGGQTLVVHWDGGNWSVIPSPNPSGTHWHFLEDVTAVSPNDVWAVGYHGSYGSGSFNTLIEHWDGTSWSIVPSPNPHPYDNYLFGVAAVSANDIWAVGGYSSGGSGPIIIHWNGTNWSVVPSPNPNGSGVLVGAASISADDVWAVGYYSNDSGGQTLVVHWDGGNWSVIPSHTTSNVLYGVTAVSPDDVWAIGHQNNGALTEHWDGATWSVVPNPNIGMDHGLNGVAAVSSNDVWAVGYSRSGTLIERYVCENPAPFLDLPFAYSNFAQAAFTTGHFSDNRTHGMIPLPNTQQGAYHERQPSPISGDPAGPQAVVSRGTARQRRPPLEHPGGDGEWDCR